MEKTKRWQLALILVVMGLTLYNILPTLFYYTQHLNSPIDEKRGAKIAASIQDRVDRMEQESIDWVLSFTRLLKIKPSKVYLDPSSSSKIHILFSSVEQAQLFKQHLPQAGSEIGFAPAQLSLCTTTDNPKEVTVLRKIPVTLSSVGDRNFLTYVKKRDESNKPSEKYRTLIFDQLCDIALGLGKKGYRPALVQAVLAPGALESKRELILRLATELTQGSTVFEKAQALQTRFLSSFTQGIEGINQQTVSQLISAFEGSRDLLKKEKTALEDGPDAQEKRALLDREESRLFQAEQLLKTHKTLFALGKKSLDKATLLRLFEETNPSLNTENTAEQLIDLSGYHPFVQKIFIDWKEDRIFLEFYSDLQSLKGSLEGSLKDELNQLLINEIAALSRMTDETFIQSSRGFIVKTGSPEGTALLTLDLYHFAKETETSLLKEIAQQWQPKHSELKELPVLTFNAYQQLPLEQKGLALITHAGEETSWQLNPSSVYLIAKGLDRMIQKYQASASSEESRLFFQDLQRLETLLRQEGYQPVWGAVVSLHPELQSDLLFIKQRPAESILQASRENFKISGSRRFATLELTNVEQRLIAQNRIETEMQDELVKWRDAFNQAQVSLDPAKKFSIPAPTANPFLSNVLLSIRKYFRGDENKIIRWGLDLSGGKTIQLELRDQNNHRVTDEIALREGINELYNRVNKMGVSEVSIRSEGDLISIDFPGSQAFSAEELIQASSMSFHIVNEKFTTQNPELREHVHRFLQEIWNEAVLTHAQDVDSLTAFAVKQLYGENGSYDHAFPRSESARILYDNGLRISLPDTLKSSECSLNLSKIVRLRGNDPSSWQDTHPLMIVFHNHVIEGSHLDEIQGSYDPAKGNFLNFSIKGSYTDKSGKKIDPKADLAAWTGKFARDQVAGTALERYSQGRGWRMAVVLNNSVISSPQLSEPLSSGGSITGSFSQKEIQTLVADLKAGSLTYTPKILSEKNVSPELGTREKVQGIIAMGIAFLAVIVAMIGYYRLAGLVASVAVLINLFIILAFLQNIQAALSLAGIAGIILNVGMAVDANVLVFERIREEFTRSGKIASAIQAGYKKAFTAIFDSNLTTILAGLILLNFDSGPIKAFAVTLIIGIISSMFTGLFMTRYFFAKWVKNPRNTTLKMMDWFRGTRFNFIKASKYVMLTSIAIILIGGAAFYQSRHYLFGMDFTGGYTFEISIDKVPDNARSSFKAAVEKTLITGGITTQEIQVRELDQKNHLKIFLSASLDQPGKPFHTLPLHKNQPLKTFVYEDNPRIVHVVDALQQAGFVISKESLTSLDASFSAISGQMSDTMKNNALLGLAIALLGIMIYLTFRFEWVYGLSAILCLMHDVLITLALLPILRWIGITIQIDLQTIAALMTIVGYSLNDTIIIFDRIRENRKANFRTNLIELTNLSINETLSRTTLTSGSTLLVLVSLVLFGSPSIFGFAFVMMLGVIFGTLSSIYIASPLMLLLSRKRGAANWSDRQRISSIGV